MELRRTWQRKLYQAGYLGMDWPSEWGGRGATEVEKSIFEAEMRARRRAADPEHPRHRAARPGAHPSRQRGAAPPLHPADARRRRDLVPGLQRAGRRQRPGVAQDDAPTIDGDHFVLNGQKVWTTFGPWADWIFVLARTDSKDRYGGISFILTASSTRRASRCARCARSPARASSARSSSRTRACRSENLVGKIGEGWRIAMTVLGYERGAIVARLRRQVLARHRGSGRRVQGARALDAAVREKLAPARGRERGHARQRRAHARHLRRRQGARPRVVDREDLLERVRQALPRDRRSTSSARAASSCATARTRGPTSTGRASSCGRAPARSTPARPRSNATSSPSAC